jgi:hypothetical protein
MVSLSIRGMPGWVNPFFLAARRPGTLSVARRRSAGAFFCGKSRVFDLWGLRRVGRGARRSDATRDAPGRPTLHTMTTRPGCKSRGRDASGARGVMADGVMEL